MGSASSAELSPALERTLGDAIMEQGRRDPTYIADPDVSQYLTDMGRSLVAQASGGSGQRITVFGVRDPRINAFALPGGYIGINSGLVVSSQSESELASVVAHEIGHVVQRHIARGLTQQSQSTGVMMAALAAALLAALSGSGDLAMGVAAFGQAAAVDRQLGFSRQAEQEADRAGFEMMRKTGYDPRGMVRMFQQLSNSSRLNEGMGGGDYASTHPLSIQRLADIENRVSEAPSVHTRGSDSYWYIRAKLRIAQARNAQARRIAIEKLQLDAKQSNGVEQSAAWYGLAYAALQQKDLAQAEDALKKAQGGGRNSPEIAGLAVSLALAKGNAADALKLAHAAWDRWPDSQGIALAKVDSLQKTGRDTEAVPFLQQLIKQWPDVPRLYQLLAQSQDRLGQNVAARRSMATYYDLTGALPTAVEQLQQARAMTKDFYIQSELDVQIRNLKERLKADRELLERFKP
ncbi:M48 family peptidase [Candidimonas sp. SYP-B2681]|nr:M48 family metalloprotease [Candidimonas sp. SYP-B2681]RTZ42307.1 M48 family peptidase [Candidimonas sp. SYP-B2681]